jgi:hypothetical protein
MPELDDQDICGLCGLPGADKFAHPMHWPGETVPDGELVHSECEMVATLSIPDPFPGQPDIEAIISREEVNL